MCFVGARIYTTSLSGPRDFLVELCVWFTNWSKAAIRNDSNRFLIFLKDLDWEVDWLVPTELFGVSWILRTASFNFDQLSGFGQVGLCTWSFNQPRNPSQSWTTMWGFIQFQWEPLVIFFARKELPLCLTAYRWCFCKAILRPKDLRPCRDVWKISSKIAKASLNFSSDYQRYFFPWS